MARKKFEPFCRIATAFNVGHERRANPPSLVGGVHYELSHVTPAAFHAGAHGTHQVIAQYRLENMVGFKLALKLFHRLHERLNRKIIVNFCLASIRELLQRQDPGGVIDHGPFDFHGLDTPAFVNRIYSFAIMRYYYCSEQIKLVIAGKKLDFWKRSSAQMNDDNEKEDEIVEEESFAELLQASFVKPVRFNPGQKVKARVVKTSAEWIFIDLGGKSEGYLDGKEFLDEEGNLSVKEGDVVEAYLLSADNNELRFTTRITGGDAGRYYLEDAWQNGIPVEGLVEKEIKGGFEIRIAGGLRGFCPFSQMGLQREGNPRDVWAGIFPSESLNTVRKGETSFYLIDRCWKKSVKSRGRSKRAFYGKGPGLPERSVPSIALALSLKSASWRGLSPSRKSVGTGWRTSTKC